MYLHKKVKIMKNDEKQFTLILTKLKHQELKVLCAKIECTMNEFIDLAIKEKIDRDFKSKEIK